jgi:hypothetical protein
MAKNVLYRDEQGLCSHCTVDTDKEGIPYCEMGGYVYRQVDTTMVVGWGEMDGPASVWQGPAVGQLLLPIETD